MPCPPVTQVRPLKVAILVGTSPVLTRGNSNSHPVSDTASKDPSTDRSGPVLKDLFAESPETWTVTALTIVPDSIPAIQSEITQWTTQNLNLIVTTGGTGFAIRDVTPEVPPPTAIPLLIVGIDTVD